MFESSVIFNWTAPKSNAYPAFPSLHRWNQCFALRCAKPKKTTEQYELYELYCKINNLQISKPNISPNITNITPTISTEHYIHTKTEQ
jgi:hypothetical protein